MGVALYNIQVTDYQLSRTAYLLLQVQCLSQAYPWQKTEALIATRSITAVLSRHCRLPDTTIRLPSPIEDVPQHVVSARTWKIVSLTSYAYLQRLNYFASIRSLASDMNQLLDKKRRVTTLRCTTY